MWGGILLFSPTVWAGSGGGERRDTHTHTHTQTHTNTHKRTQTHTNAHKRTHAHTHTRTHAHTHTQRNTHRNTHTGTYTRMLHLPFSDLPLKKCPTTDMYFLVKTYRYRCQPDIFQLSSLPMPVRTPHPPPKTPQNLLMCNSSKLI